MPLGYTGWFIGGTDLISLAYAYIVSMSKDMFMPLLPLQTVGGSELTGSSSETFPLPGGRPTSTCLGG